MQLEFTNQNHNEIFVNEPIQNRKLDNINKTNSSEKHIESETVVPQEKQSSNSHQHHTLDTEMQVEENIEPHNISNQDETKTIQEKLHDNSKSIQNENFCDIEIANEIEAQNNTVEFNKQNTPKITTTEIIQEASSEENSSGSEIEEENVIKNQNNSKNLNTQNISNKEKKSTEIIHDKSHSIIDKPKSKYVQEENSSDREIEEENVHSQNDSHKSNKRNISNKDTQKFTQEKSHTIINSYTKEKYSANSEIELENVSEPQNNLKKTNIRNISNKDTTDIIQEKFRSSINKSKSKLVVEENTSDGEIELDTVIQLKNTSKKSNVVNTPSKNIPDIIQEKSRSSIIKNKSKSVPEEYFSDNQIELENVNQLKNKTKRKFDMQNKQKKDTPDINQEKSRSSINKHKSKSLPEENSSDSEVENENLNQLQHLSKISKPQYKLNRITHKSQLSVPEENSSDDEIDNDNLNQLQNATNISKPQYKLTNKNQFVRNKSHSLNKKIISKIVPDQNNSTASEIEVQNVNLADNEFLDNRRQFISRKSEHRNALVNNYENFEQHKNWPNEYLMQMNNLKSKSIRRTHNENRLNTGTQFHHQQQQLNHKYRYSKHISRLERTLYTGSSSDSSDNQNNKKYKLTDNRNVAHKYYQHSIQYKDKNNKKKRKYYHGTKSDIDSEREIQHHKRPKLYKQIIHYVNSGASINRNNPRISQKPNRKRSKTRNRQYNFFTSSDSETNIKSGNGKKRCLQPLKQIQNQFNTSSELTSDLESNCEKITNQKTPSLPQKDVSVNNVQKNVPQKCYQSNSAVGQPEDEIENCESTIVISNRSTQIDNRNLIIDKNLSYKNVNNLDKNKTNELQKSHRELVEEQRTNENIESINQTNIVLKENQENPMQKDSKKNKKQRINNNGPLTGDNIPIEIELYRSKLRNRNIMKPPPKQNAKEVNKKQMAPPSGVQLLSNATAINFERLSQCANESQIIELSPMSSQVQKNHVNIDFVITIKLVFPIYLIFILFVFFFILSDNRAH